MSVFFKKRTSISQVEEGVELAPKFHNDLLPVVTTSNKDGLVLMLGYMNKEALEKTIETGFAHYFSRSRKKIWKKGETSGLVQKIIEMNIDDDQDSLWIVVDIPGTEASCHVGYRSCFYRSVILQKDSTSKQDLIFKEKNKTFDEKKMYSGLSNPTII
jgi:phosphoribosyl-AMP cyclohydrolase